MQGNARIDVDMQYYPINAAPVELALETVDTVRLPTVLVVIESRGLITTLSPTLKEQMKDYPPTPLKHQLPDNRPPNALWKNQTRTENS